MADQDWKRGGLNRGKYIIARPCPECGGARTVCGCGARGLADCTCIIGVECPKCQGRGSIPVDPQAAYFVLCIDCDPTTGEPYDPNARRALRVYANSVSGENPEFAANIHEWLEETEAKGGEARDER